jgi:hypothetical protein
MSSLIQQTWQHSVVFALGSSKETAQSLGSTSMSVFGTFPFAVGYFFTKFSSCRVVYVVDSHTSAAERKLCEDLKNYLTNVQPI